MGNSLYSSAARSFIATAVALAAFGLPAAALAQTPSPREFAGNPSCADIDQEFGESWLEYKIEPIRSGTTTFDNGEISGSITADGGVKSFSFSVTPGVDAVIVKGGPSANAYVYEVDATSGSGLVAPDGSGLSHISFCYDIKGSISGTKWHDLDADGVKDSGEPVLSGWKFYLDLNGDGDRDSNEPIATTDAAGKYSFTDLAFGTYTVRELPASQQPNTTLTQCSTPVSCSYTFTLTSSHRNKTGDFGNYAPAKLTVVKQTEPDGATGTFAFSSNVPNNNAFDLSDGQSKGPLTLKPGTYTATENVPLGWSLKNIVCTGDSDSSGSGQTATFRLSSGEDVTCTFTNTKLAKIIVEKQTLPDETNGASFGFTPSANLGSGFSLADDATKTYENVAPGGSYTVAENAAAGYRLTSVVCDDSDSVESVASRNADIKVSPGETVKCTFTNTKIVPAINIVKTGTTKAHHGDLLTYHFAVTNTGNSALHDVVVTDDKCAPVTGPVSKSNDDGDALLENPGTNGTSSEVWNYTCSYNAPANHTVGEANPIHNIATVTGKDEENKTVTDTDDHDTVLLHPQITVDKTLRREGSTTFVQGPITAHVGDKVEYRFAVTTTGDPLTVTISDPKCDAAPAGPTGDDGDGLLEQGETWIYTCSHVLTASDPDPFDNTVCVEGMDEIGGPKGTVADCDDARVDIIHPDIELDKKVRRSSADAFVDGPITAAVGDTIQYQFTVTNAGDTELAVEFSDPKCDANTLTAFSGDADNDGKLDVTETWVATCTHVLTAADGASLVNVATVKGTDSLGGTDTDTDTATVTVPGTPPPPNNPQQQQQAQGQPQAQPTPVPTVEVLPDAVISGVSRLTGPSGCVSKRFTARVTGRRIATAVFRIDGKVVKRFRNARGEATKVNLRVNPLRYGRGTHRLTIRVTYNAAAKTPAKTLRMTFARCARAGTGPRFTG